eukprot:5329150-Amphidinium_carterae.3
MATTKIPTTNNPADALTKHLPAATINSHLDRLCLQVQTPTTVNALLGLPTSRTTTNEKQTFPPTTETRVMRISQAQQYRRRRSARTPPRNEQATATTRSCC